jgi:hypothetical protein
MAKEPDEALDRMAEETRTLGEGLGTEMKEDLDKAKGEGGPPKRPWWKVWARS